jgi:plasmid stabilization system protein ParE
MQRVELRQQFEEEAAEARDWYDAQRPGLGDRFLDAVEATIDRVAELPLSFPRVDGETRWARVQRFPYAIYYQVREDYILVVAIMHSSRHPDRWRSRS